MGLTLKELLALKVDLFTIEESNDCLQIIIHVHQDGLVHKSKMSKRFVKNPLDIVKLNDIVEVTVLEVDLKRKRIQLSMVEK